jgi:hypothetical protein
MSEWWTAEQAVWIGSIGGSALGVLGGLFGTVVGVCAPRGVARLPVLAGHAALAALGVLVLLVGIVAVALAAQPYHVYYPLLLGGFISSAVLLPLLPVVRARYRQAEARRLEAEELRRT